MPGSSTRLERMRATLRREAEIITNLAAQLNQGFEAAVDLLFETRGHVLVGGAGTSNATARRFAHLLCCCGVPAVFISAADCLHGASGVVTAADTVVLISKGGKTVEVNQCARIVRQRGARLVALTEEAESELGLLADAVVVVRIPPESDPFGMVATSSSLAVAAMSDAICETLLFEKGYTREKFAVTHPGGAVGERIQREGILK